MRIIVLLLFSSLGFAQQSATTSGPCSPIAPNNTGAITINCPGMSKQQGQKMIDILNKILKDQLDPNVVLTKLDEIQTGVSSIRGELETKKHQEEDAERVRRTAPIIDAYLQPVNGKIYLYMKSKNLIPYEFRYFIVNSSNTILGGFPIAMQAIYPKADDDLKYIVKDDIDLKAVPDHYVELRFLFQSLSYDELQLPGHAGEIIRKYKISSDGTSLELIP
jgi:hypothetical protein